MGEGGGTEHLSRFIPMHLPIGGSLLGCNVDVALISVHRMRFHGFRRTRQVCGQKGVMESLLHFMLRCL